MDKVTTAQIHPEIACSKLLRTDKQTDGKRPPVFCRLVLTPLARSILNLVLSGVGKGQFNNCPYERWRLFISGCVCAVKSFRFWITQKTCARSLDRSNERKARRKKALRSMKSLSRKRAQILYVFDLVSVHDGNDERIKIARLIDVSKGISPCLWKRSLHKLTERLTLFEFAKQKNQLDIYVFDRYNKLTLIDTGTKIRCFVRRKVMLPRQPLLPLFLKCVLLNFLRNYVLYCVKLFDNARVHMI